MTVEETAAVRGRARPHTGLLVTHVISLISVGIVYVVFVVKVAVKVAVPFFIRFDAPGCGVKCSEVGDLPILVIAHDQLGGTQQAACNIVLATRGALCVAQQCSDARDF